MKLQITAKCVQPSFQEQNARNHLHNHQQRGMNSGRYPFTFGVLRQDINRLFNITHSDRFSNFYRHIPEIVQCFDADIDVADAAC